MIGDYGEGPERLFAPGAVLACLEKYGKPANPFLGISLAASFPSSSASAARILFQLRTMKKMPIQIKTCS